MNRDPIADLVHHYADAVVHRDRRQWEATWAEAATWDLGRGHRFEGRADIVAFWEAAMAGLDAVIQVVLNGTYLIDASGVTGSGRWYVQELTRRSDRHVRSADGPLRRQLRV